MADQYTINSAAIPQNRALPVGDTIGKTFRVIGSAWGKLYALSLLVALLGLPIKVLLPQVTAAITVAKQTKTPLKFPPYLFAELGGAYAVQLLVSLMIYGAIAWLALRVLEGKPSGDTLKVALARFLPLLVSAMLLYLMMVIGFVLIIVPGIIAGAVYGLGPTACVVERCGPFASFSRSAYLTRSNRLRCIGVTIILTLLPALAVSLIAIVVGAVAGPYARLAVSIIGSFAIMPILYVFPTALYYELRRIKEGGAHAGVMAVF